MEAEMVVEVEMEEAVETVVLETVEAAEMVVMEMVEVTEGKMSMAAVTLAMVRAATKMEIQTLEVETATGTEMAMEIQILMVETVKVMVAAKTPILTLIQTIDDDKKNITEKVRWTEFLNCRPFLSPNIITAFLGNLFSEIKSNFIQLMSYLAQFCVF